MHVSGVYWVSAFNNDVGVGPLLGLVFDQQGWPCNLSSSDEKWLDPGGRLARPSLWTRSANRLESGFFFAMSSDAFVVLNIGGGPIGFRIITSSSGNKVVASLGDYSPAYPGFVFSRICMYDGSAQCPT
jgi:hypothetical protein